MQMQKIEIELPISLINFEDYQEELDIMGVSFSACQKSLSKKPLGIEWK
jgi:hypothetical protein